MFGNLKGIVFQKSEIKEFQIALLKYMFRENYFMFDAHKI